MVVSSYMQMASFNRTSLELKLKEGAEKAKEGIELLIEPVWN